jgi:3-oxoacyl-[acyl-carrier-protein] synthase II
MKLALADAGREPKDVDYVNLHGTSTLLNDRIETSAMKLAFDGYAARIPMSATKSKSDILKAPVVRQVLPQLVRDAHS